MLKLNSSTGVLTFFTRVRVESSKSQFLEVDKLSSNAQTIESFTNSQVFNSLSKCKVAMLKVRCQRGNDTKQMLNHDSPKACWEVH